ncbi:ABC-type glycerol-3-phosphate transport system, substrate-binding protein [Evansella caseinilytica]|uniref:ABC-type glycerol-3-phosphate transport system, substrate-binding protein n=1 Tax=Evansella caseinilytica TaxID=1503961 RepID=A0A1H3NUT2_9BACI|nr:extracellular solute-binding protein [Evansella caseinilytica]SDY91929.1 ABC-type glycerol-3-phosphate transport system, substrate-binding protein [Evansella caseinilytica]
MSKWKAIILCIFLFALTACGNADVSQDSGEDADAPDNSEEVGEDATGEETTEVDDYQTPEMDFDLGGRTIKIVAWWDMTIGEDNPDSIQRKQNLEELMEKHNFEVEYIAIDYGEYQERVTASLLAGEPIGDIVRLGKNYTIPALVQQDLLWPVDEYTKNENAFNQLVTNELFTYEGRGYAFTDDQTNLIQGFFYNRTLMNELGMKPLQEYVDEDDWNWDTFMEVIREANQDTNNDGSIDTWGLANRSLVQQALIANNTALTDGDQQNLDEPATVAALNIVSQIVNQQLARPTEGGDWTEPSQFFRQGNTLLYAGALYEFNGFQDDMPEYDLGFLPFPKGPNATEYHTFESALQAITIPKSVDNPEQLVYLWEKIHDIDSIYDYPGQAAFESTFTNEEDIENARMVASNLIVLDHFAFPNLQYWEFESELIEGTSVSTVIEKYAAAFQAAIDEVYGN